MVARARIRPPVLLVSDLCIVSIICTISLTPSHVEMNSFVRTASNIPMRSINSCATFTHASHHTYPRYQLLIHYIHPCVGHTHVAARCSRETAAALVFLNC